MRHLESFGAAGGEVTGSCHVVTDNNNRKVLVDFGMFQGADEHNDSNYIPPNFDPREIDSALITHAHLDHTGRLPFLTQDGYRGPIYTTEPTRELARLVLEDAAEIQRMNARRGECPLYSSADVAQVMARMKAVPYDQPFEVGGFTATFRDAGHILGSASVELTEREVTRPETLVFSGDLGNDDPYDILRAKRLIDRADVVVMESTYGDREHSAENPEEMLGEEINEIEKRGGTLLIPAFSIERTQRLLYMIRTLKERKQVKPKTKVFLDSPMGYQATTVFERYKDYLQDEVVEADDPFRFEGLIVTRAKKQSMEIQKIKGPKVIIAGSGMMNGGRIRQHAINYLGRPNTRILFCGFQSPGSLGELIQSGAPEVLIDHELIHVNATVSTLGSLSAHAGQGKLKEWISHPDNVRKVILVHGVNSAREALAGEVRQELGIDDVVLPQIGQPIDLSYPSVMAAAAD